MVKNNLISSNLIAIRNSKVIAKKFFLGISLKSKSIPNEKSLGVEKIKALGVILRQSL